MLAVMMWMFIEVVDMYIMFVKIFMQIRHFVKKASVVAWGVPLIISVATLGAHFGLATYKPNTEILLYHDFNDPLENPV